MIIIFEGPDKSGKSTLINNLQGIIMKNMYIPKDGSDGERWKYKHAYNIILRVSRRFHDMPYNILMDRSYISEMVYSLPRRNYEGIEDVYFRHCSSAFRKLDCIVIYCTAKDETLWERCLKHGDKDPSENEFKMIKERYERIFNDEKLKLSRRLIDTDKMSIEEAIDDIKYVIERLGGTTW